MSLINTLKLLVLFIGISGFAQNETLFETANAAYIDGDFEKAIASYEQILANNEHSAALYFNLANAHYKLNHTASSIYYYEKALELSPNDSEILNNINFARNMTIDAIDTLPEVGFSRIIKQLTTALSFDGWAVLAIVAMLLFTVAFVLYYIAVSTAKKRLLFTFSTISLFVSLAFLTLAFNKVAIDKNNNPAIIFAKESTVKSEPNLGSSDVFILHEGTKVQILDTVNNWKRIKLSDGKTGWIQTNELKAL